MSEAERFWKKLLGYRVGETAVIHVRRPISIHYGEVDVVFEGEVVEIGQGYLKLKLDSHTTVTIPEEDIL